MKAILSLLVFFSLVLSTFAEQGSRKHWVLVLTDIENEPDDAMSMVRFLTY